jgi:hypothetical protein
MLVASVVLAGLLLGAHLLAPLARFHYYAWRHRAAPELYQLPPEVLRRVIERHMFEEAARKLVGASTFGAPCFGRDEREALDELKRDGSKYVWFGPRFCDAVRFRDGRAESLLEDDVREAGGWDALKAQARAKRWAGRVGLVAPERQQESSDGSSPEAR